MTAFGIPNLLGCNQFSTARRAPDTRTHNIVHRQPVVVAVDHPGSSERHPDPSADIRSDIATVANPIEASPIP